MASLSKSRPVYPSFPAIDDLEIPAELSGGSRFPDTPHVSFADDRTAIQTWLSQYEGTTARAYRREVERLLFWSIFQRKKALSSLAWEDMAKYEQFLRNPQPAGLWITKPGEGKRARSHVDWRPFAAPLNDSGVTYTRKVLNTFFDWLVSMRYIRAAPMLWSIPRKSEMVISAPGSLEHQVESCIASEILWGEITKTLDGMPRNTERQCRRAVHFRWVCTLTYMVGLRASVAMSAKMGDIIQEVGKDGKTDFYLKVGGKEQYVQLSLDTVTVLSEYRTINKLKAYPLPGEVTPLVMPLIRHGENHHSQANMVAYVINTVFEETSEQLHASESAESRKLGAELGRVTASCLRRAKGSKVDNQKLTREKMLDAALKYFEQ